MNIMNIMNIYGGMEVQLHSFLTSSLYGTECSASPSGRFRLGELVTRNP